MDQYVLILDDELGVRKLLSLILEDFNTQTASHVDEALELMKTKKFDLVISDLKMPGKSGFDFIKEAKELYPELLIIVITGNGDKKNAIESLQLGVYDFLEKPFDEEQIVHTIKKALEKKRFLLENKRLVEELKNSKEALETISLKRSVIQEEERKKVAQSIHDELGQQLAVLKIDMQLLKKKLEEPESLSALEKMEQKISFAIQTIRKISANLSPSILSHMGLADAIESEIKDIQEQIGLSYKLTFDDIYKELDPHAAITLFRVFQEAMNNVMKHAHAQSVKIKLYEKQESVFLEVIDDGTGIIGEKNPQGFGLINMKEHLHALGGKIHLQTLNPGTLLQAQIPANQSKL